MDDRYFEWLVRKIKGNKSEVQLLRMLDGIIYRYRIQKDENRAVDGLLLREEFATIYPDIPIKNGPCTVLEMLVGLACRVDRDITGTSYEEHPEQLFWIFIQNLCINIHMNFEEVDRIVEKWMDGKFDKTGQGGLFPLRHPTRDMRRVEIWYQLSAWLEENFE